MGTLIVVGTGIHVGQLTIEAKEWLQHSDKVLYCVSDAASERLILQLNKNAESLYPFYGEGKRRSETYDQMVSRTMECLEQVDTLTVAYYGHPGFFVSPSHRSVKLARQRGHTALMLPSVSSFDCLIADLGVNVASGCQIYEATDLMIRERRLDVSSHVIILQVSSLGDFSYSFDGFDHRNLGSLREYLASYYSADFKVTVYYAAQFAISRPRIEEITIEALDIETIKSVATLYIPPLRPAALHMQRLEEYGLETLLSGHRLVPLNVSSPDEIT